MDIQRSVLVVDDDDSGRTMLGFSLRRAGFAVDTAASGDQALCFLGKNRYDWLVTDAKMEPMDGFELSRRAKRLHPDLRIIMISALFSEKDTLVAPIDEFVPKPIRLDRLVGAMHAA